MRVLTGDIGGTKTALAIQSVEPGATPTTLHSARYPSAGPGLRPLIERVLAELGPPAGDDAAGFAIAGPVVDDRVRTTNLPWEIDAGELSASLGRPVALINDFHGVALGVTALADDQLEWLQPARRDPHGEVAVIGAGTGLGEAILVPTPTGPRVIAGAGGHCDLAPRDELEIDLLRFLLGRHARVSYERVVSGRGLHALYEFIVDRGHAPALPATRARMAAEDPGAVVGELGGAGTDPACVRAVELFVGLYGAEAGNLALKSIPTGGLYIAGGVALHLRPQLRAGFMPAFLAKGRMSKLLAELPVALVLDPQVGLRGAALAAAARLG